jgi:bacterioferritin
MEAKEGVLEFLNTILTAELTAVHQYVAHAAMSDHWGYERLHHEIHARALEEVKHAEGIVEHILYLEGAPEMQRLGNVNIGQTVQDQFKNDLKLEMDDLALLREAITHCARVGDYTTRHKLEEMSVDTDEHIDWLETQLETIKQVGLENYLSEQIKKGS